MSVAVCGTLLTGAGPGGRAERGPPALAGPKRGGVLVGGLCGR